MDWLYLIEWCHTIVVVLIFLTLGVGAAVGIAFEATLCRDGIRVRPSIRYTKYTFNTTYVFTYMLKSSRQIETRELTSADLLDVVRRA
jgi:hypothetical protein